MKSTATETFPDLEEQVRTYLTQSIMSAAHTIDRAIKRIAGAVAKHTNSTYSYILASAPVRTLLWCCTIICWPLDWLVQYLPMMLSNILNTISTSHTATKVRYTLGCATWLTNIGYCYQTWFIETELPRWGSILSTYGPTRQLLISLQKIGSCGAYLALSLARILIYSYRLLLTGVDLTIGRLRGLLKTTFENMNDPPSMSPKKLGYWPMTYLTASVAVTCHIMGSVLEIPLFFFHLPERIFHLFKQFATSLNSYDPEQSDGRRHPAVIYLLSFIELWERLSFYLMLSLLKLYCSTPIEQGGMGMSSSEALAVYGSYIAFVYLSPYYGGRNADRRFGYWLSALIGAICMSIGHGIGAIHGSRPLFYTGLVFLVIGNGLFKPTMSSMVGALYPANSPLRDEAYGIFYLGVNIGAAIASLAANLMRTGKIPFTQTQIIPDGYHGWSWAFGTAWVGMMIATITLVIFRKTILRADTAAHRHAEAKNLNLPKPVETPPSPLVLKKRRLRLMIGSIVLIYTIASIFQLLPVTAALRNPLSMAYEFIAVKLGSLPIAQLKYKPIDALFWGGITLTILSLTWPRTVKSTNIVFEALQTARLKWLNLIFVVGTFFWMAFHQNGGTLTEWAEKNTRTTWDPEVFQLFNSLFIIILTKPLQRAIRKIEERWKIKVETPTKVVIGMMLTGAAYGIMTIAGLVGGDHGKVSPAWLISSYFVMTVAELLVSPMILSLISKLAPKDEVGRLMGGWYIATAVGNKFVGDTGEKLWEHIPHSRFFAILVASSLASALALSWYRKRIEAALPSKIED